SKPQKPDTKNRKNIRGRFKPLILFVVTGNRCVEHQEFKYGHNPVRLTMAIPSPWQLRSASSRGLPLLARDERGRTVCTFSEVFNPFGIASGSIGRWVGQTVHVPGEWRCWLSYEETRPLVSANCGLGRGPGRRVPGALCPPGLLH